MSLTQAKLHTLLHYNPSTGEFTRRCAASNMKPGDLANNVSCAGYIRIMIDGVRYQAHRLAWLYVYGEYPKGRIDHRDGDKANNRIDNLRLATPSQNSANSRLRVNNKAGYKGVVRHHNKWRAQIRKDGRGVHLGLFKTPEEAHAAYLAAASELHGEFARAH